MYLWHNAGIRFEMPTPQNQQYLGECHYLYDILIFLYGNLSVCAQMHKHMQRVKLNMKALLLSLHRSESLLSATKSYYIHLSITEQG